jgi:putative SOS response-associated peptidase YedK
MCGRYAASRRLEDLIEEFEIEAVAEQAPGEDLIEEFEPDYNVAPTKTAPVVFAAQVDQDADRPARRLRLFTWGLVPWWAEDRGIAGRLINARAETILDKPAYRTAVLAQRCLIPADGWFEWQVSPTAVDDRGRPRRQPFFIRPADGTVAAIAGVYDLWRDRTRHADDPQAWLASFSVVTVRAEPGLRAVHDRMPLVLPRSLWGAWLDPLQRDPDTLRALLQPAAPGRFAAVPVSLRVNAASNNGPELLEPLPTDQLVGVVDPATGALIGAGDVPLF